MCGKTDANILTEIEGVQLRTCMNCAKLGRQIRREYPTQKAVIPKPRIVAAVDEVAEEIVEDYFEVIKKAREKQGLTQEQLAIKINEKSTLIHKAETGHMAPTIALARKLEKALGIKLVEEVKTTKSGGGQASSGSLTIGDIIKIRK